MNPRRKPEVKSPAGYWPQLNAAVEAGADAVYFGLRRFTARAKAGFAPEELEDALRALRMRGVRGYVTFNTLIFEDELAEAARTIEFIARAGADGLIVQDWAAVKMARDIAPQLALHGSTQMSITDAPGVVFARQQGVERVTLARELSLKEIEAIANAADGDLELFVHGALCVAYSGQCFSSEAWGGRSANRGQCAQACRMPYEMMVDGVHQPLGDARYLLSPGDLCALHQIPEMMRMGIAAFKIEGRYKDAEYVALVTRAYRKAVDDAWAHKPANITPGEELALEQVYSRGLGPFFLTGTNHQAVVRGRAPRHRGVRMGVVARIGANSVFLEPFPAHQVSPLKAGDGVVFDAADWRSPQEEEEGGSVFAVSPCLDGSLEITFANSAMNFGRIRRGDVLWRSHDLLVERAAKPFTEAHAPVARQPVNVHVIAHEDQRLTATWSPQRDLSLRATVQSSEPLGAAKNHALDESWLREHLGRLGGTPYELAELTLDLRGQPFAPASLLNQLRREAVEILVSSQSVLPARIIRHAAPKPPRAVAERSSVEHEIHVLVRTPEQLEAALELAPASITLDYLDLYGLRPSLERVKSAGCHGRVASPRVLKPAEARIVDFLASLQCPIVVRGSGMIGTLKASTSQPLIGDFSLNAANSLTAQMFLDLGLARLTPTHDLNAAQVAQLACDLPPGTIEVIAYQHLPVFHTEHCVFCRFMSTGTSYKDCGRPCEKHRVELRDSSGRAHPVMADVGCRNTVFGAEAQQASAHLGGWIEAGVRHWRLEFVHESDTQLQRVYCAFASALNGRLRFSDLASELRRIAPQGTTEGSLFVPQSDPRLPVLRSS